MSKIEIINNLDKINQFLNVLNKYSFIQDLDKSKRNINRIIKQYIRFLIELGKNPFALSEPIKKREYFISYKDYNPILSSYEIQYINEIWDKMNPQERSEFLKLIDSSFALSNSTKKWDKLGSKIIAEINTHLSLLKDCFDDLMYKQINKKKFDLVLNSLIIWWDNLKYDTKTNFLKMVYQYNSLSDEEKSKLSLYFSKLTIKEWLEIELNDREKIKQFILNVKDIFISYQNKASQEYINSKKITLTKEEMEIVQKEIVNLKNYYKLLIKTILEEIKKIPEKILLDLISPENDTIADFNHSIQDIHNKLINLIELYVPVKFLHNKTGHWERRSNYQSPRIFISEYDSIFNFLELKKLRYENKLKRYQYKGFICFKDMKKFHKLIKYLSSLVSEGIIRFKRDNDNIIMYSNLMDASRIVLSAIESIFPYNNKDIVLDLKPNEVFKMPLNFEDLEKEIYQKPKDNSKMIIYIFENNLKIIREITKDIKMYSVIPFLQELEKEDIPIENLRNIQYDIKMGFNELQYTSVFQKYTPLQSEESKISLIDESLEKLQLPPPNKEIFLKDLERFMIEQDTSPYFQDSYAKLIKNYDLYLEAFIENSEKEIKGLKEQKDTSLQEIKRIKNEKDNDSIEPFIISFEVSFSDWMEKIFLLKVTLDPSNIYPKALFFNNIIFELPNGLQYLSINPKDFFNLEKNKFILSSATYSYEHLRNILNCIDLNKKGVLKKPNLIIKGLINIELKTNHPLHIFTKLELSKEIKVRLDQYTAPRVEEAEFEEDDDDEF